MFVFYYLMTQYTLKKFNGNTPEIIILLYSRVGVGKNFYEGINTRCVKAFNKIYSHLYCCVINVLRTKIEVWSKLDMTGCIAKRPRFLEKTGLNILF